MLQNFRTWRNFASGIIKSLEVSPFDSLDKKQIISCEASSETNDIELG